MANVNDRLGQAAFPDQYMPEAADDVAAAAIPSGNPYQPVADPNLPSGAKIDSVLSDKQAQVKAAADLKRTAMGGLPTDYQMAVGRVTGAGGERMSERESDIRTMDPMDLYTKYGSEAKDMIRGIAEAGNEVGLDRGRADRSFIDYSLDSTKSVASGLGNAVAGLANLGIGAISSNAGATVAGAIEDANKYVESTKSDTLAARKRVQEGMNFLDQRDSRVMEAEDISSGKSELIAGLDRIGRDAISSVSNATADGATFIDGTANALGSLLAAGPIAKGIKAAGAAVIPKATQRGVGMAGAMDAAAGNLSVARGLAAIGSQAPILASIAGTEAGGSYQQVTADIAGRSHEKLAEESPMYRELIEQGVEPDEARNQVANRTGLMAAAITAPLAAVTGTLVSKFEASPFAAKTVRGVVQNMLKEAPEEAIQGGIGQTAQNFAEQELANENKNLSDDVGRQVGEGALYGLGMSAAVQAVPLTKGAAKAVGGTALAFADKALGSVADRADAVMKANEAASPLAAATVNEQAAQAVQTAPESQAVVAQAIEESTADPEVKSALQAYSEKLGQVAQFNADEVSPTAAKWLSNATSRAEAMHTLSDVIENTPEDSNEHVEAAVNMLRLMEPLSSLDEADPAGLDTLPADSQASKILNELAQLNGRMQKTPTITAALVKAQTALNNYKPAPVTEASLATPQGQQEVQNSIAVASYAPEKADLATTEQILYHAAQGRINITPEQKAILNTSAGIQRAIKATGDEIAKFGNGAKAAKVTNEILSKEGPKGKSTLQHAKEIVSAYKAGNVDLARDRIAGLGQFVQHMQNKVGAINSHLAQGANTPKVQYEAVRQDGTWFTTQGEAGLSVHPSNVGSIKFAQSISTEAKLVADVYNSMVAAFPELGAKHIDVAPLESSLALPAAEVVRNFKQPAAVTPTPVVDAISEPVKAPPKKSVDYAASVARLDDASLNERVNQLLDTKNRTPEQESEFNAADAELSRRETEAQAQNEAAEIDETETTPVVPLKGIRAVYPDLVNGEDNHFVKAYTLPQNQQSRLSGSESPVQTLKNALTNSAAYTAFTGSSVAREFTPELITAYQGLIRNADGIVDALNDNLTKFVTGKGKNIAQSASWPNGKALNIAEEVDGQIQYNQELIESAALAALQWSLTTEQLGSILDDKDVAKITGLNSDMVSSAMIDTMNQGMSVQEAKQTMAQKIRNYWGVRSNRDADIGFTDGIPEAVAAEILDLFVDRGLLLEVNFAVTDTGAIVEYTKPNKPRGTTKTFDRLLTPNQYEMKLNPKFKKAENPFAEFPSAIEQAVMLTPEGINYIGDLRPTVAKTQLRNAIVDNTPQQLEAIANEQETPYFVNPTVASLYMALGKENLLKMFGAGAIDQDQMNKNHYESLDGQNRNTAAAFNHLEELMAEMAGTAQATSVSLDQVPVRFAFNMTRVARLQMLGKYNPQSNKLVREAIMPTQSVLDLSTTTGQDYSRFMLGVAQSFGIKVHKMSQEASRADAEEMIVKLAPVIEALERGMKNYDNPTDANLAAMSVDSDLADVMIKAFKDAGADLTPHSLHAVTQLAWLNKQTPEQRKAFKTSLYLEADGVTNGPINAMVLLTAGKFDENWVKNIAKGGLYFNRGAETVNSHNSNVDGRDMYQATTDVLKTKLDDLRTSLKANNPKAALQMNDLFVVMDEFLGKDLNFDADGNLELTRGIAKNPLTVTIYGAGENGIAGKVAKTVIDELYARLSQSIQGTGSISPEVGKALNQLLATKMRPSKNGLVIEGNKVTRKEFDPKTFTVTEEEMANLRSNMRYLFVDPMREAIDATVGSALTKSANMLRMATQAQSIILEHAFKVEMTALMEQKKAADPTWKQSDLFSAKEMDGIYKKLEHLSPLIKTPTQTFFVAGSQSSDVFDNEGKGVNIGQAFSDRFRTPASLYGPANAGVSGIPFMNIGTGDGQMMQNISVDPNAPTGTLKVFDGMNMPLDQIESGSLVANQAVYDSWMGNPLQYVHASYSAFLKNADLEQTFDKPTQEALSEALFGLGKTEAKMDEIRQVMDTLNDTLLASSQEVEARHWAMSQVQISVDQMASAATPLVREGKVELIGSDSADIAAQLNVLYEQKLAEIRGDRTVTSIATAIQELATKQPTGAYVLNAPDLRQLTRALKLEGEQADILAQIVESTATKQYRVVYGSRKQVVEHIEQNGGTAPQASGEVFGFTAFNEKTIYLNTPDTETLVHELMHAATFETVLDHYIGLSSPRAAQAVKRNELLMDQFLNLELSQVSPTVSQSYNDAVNAINGYLQAEPTPQNKAAALNEFMAWNLSNRSLISLGQRTKATKLAQISASVFEAIKSFFTRNGRTAPTKGDDLFSNLLFNSSILMQRPRSGRETLASNVLFQNTIYGDDQRLTVIADAFSDKVGRYLQDPLQLGTKLPSAVVSEAIMSSYRVAQGFMARGFNMNMQQSSTFSNIVAALATEAKIDPNALQAASSLYSYVTKNLQVEDFMADPTDDAQRYYAQEKYNAVMGVGLTEIDNAGRSTLLPAFLALAVTNDEFRAVLAKMDLPKTEKNTAGTLDAVLENTANGLMDKLTAKMSGIKNSNNVQQAIDALSKHIVDQAEERDTYISTMAAKPGGIVDAVNTRVTDGITWLSQGLLDADKKAAARGAGRVTRLATGFGAGIGALVNEESGQRVSEGVMTAMNRSNVWEPFHTLVNDIVGRTASNATIYDMIKSARAMVQQSRQQFRENLPALIAGKFSRQLSKAEWATLHVAMGKTDLASLRDGMSKTQITNVLTKRTERAKAIKALEADLRAEDANNFSLLQSKAKQLANYMMTGEVGNNLLRNAFSVAQLMGEAKKKGFATKDAAFVSQLDKLISLYALDGLNQEQQETFASLVQSEADGIDFTLSYLVGQRAEEQRKAVNAAAKINHFKGHIPSGVQDGTSLIVADDTEFSKLRTQSYERLGAYKGSSIDSPGSKSYYFAPVAARAGFEQGIMQNVRQTVSGVDATTGYSLAQNAGRITEPTKVEAFAKRLSRENNNTENLMPVYDINGKVVAFERSLDPVIMQRMQGEQHLAKTIGMWRGRQVEEAKAQFFNEGLIDAMKDMYTKDLKASKANQEQYVNVFASGDPVVRDAVKLFNRETQDYIKNAFGDEFWVRKDMLNDALGYRSASVGDSWTGNSRWSKKTQDAVKNLAISAFGNEAYSKAVNAERVVKNFVSDAKVLIVVKSVVVPVSNLMSNVYQLAARGVPLASIIKSFPKKTAEIDSYVKSRIRQIEAEAELRAAAGDLREERKLKTEIQAISDDHKRLSIWPLIEAGEFSSISDAGLSRDEIMLTEGRLQQYIEQLVAKLPGPVATMGRYAMITKDTALFQGLQKAVEYGDFLGKAVLYDDLINRQKKDKAYALGRITEEFVNYDRLAGRFRGSLENLGLLWFYNFKIRSVKVAMSMIRNNPVHTLLATVAPAPTFFGSVGLPTLDNMFAKMADGTIDYSIGPGQGLRAPMLNPWMNLVQ